MRSFAAISSPLWDAVINQDGGNFFEFQKNTKKYIFDQNQKLFAELLTENCLIKSFLEKRKKVS